MDFGLFLIKKKNQVFRMFMLDMLNEWEDRGRAFASGESIVQPIFLLIHTLTTRIGYLTQFPKVQNI